MKKEHVIFIHENMTFKRFVVVICHFYGDNADFFWFYVWLLGRLAHI